MNSTDQKPKSRAEREAEAQARTRAEIAGIVAGLKKALAPDEQLLGFARGRLAGGIRGKLSLGPEAFFAPFVNIGLTERRLIVQHINAETGRPGEILPHYYAIGDIAALTFTDIETFGGDAAARLTVRLRNEQHMRMRLRGQGNFENARTIVEVFRSLTTARRPVTTPTQRVCATCQHILDQPFRFCPYCGQQQESAASPAAAAAPEQEERVYPHTPPGATEPEFLDTVPYGAGSGFGGPTVEDGLDLLRAAPAEPEAGPVSEAAAAEPTEEGAPEFGDPRSVSVSEAAAPEEEPEAPPLETPSAFEGWSVDPGASGATVEPSANGPDAASAEERGSNESFAPVAGGFEAEAPIESPAPEHAGPAGVPSGLVSARDAAGDTAPLAAPIEAVAASVEADRAGSAFVVPAESGPVPGTEGAVAPDGPGSAFERAPSVFESEGGFEGGGPAAAGYPSWPSAPSAGETPERLDPVFAAPPASGGTAFSPEPAPALANDGALAGPDMGAAAVSDQESKETYVSHNGSDDIMTAESGPGETAGAASPEVTVAEIGAAEAAHAPSPEEEVRAPQPVYNTDPVGPEVSESTSGEAFAAGGGEPAAGPHPAPAPPRERHDGPMRVHVRIDGPPISVNESFEGRNAEEVVANLKRRVLPELNFAMRLMVNSFSTLRFAQEVVRLYNGREKTDYPIPGSCWEFLQSAEAIGLATIHLDR